MTIPKLRAIRRFRILAAATLLACAGTPTRAEDEALLEDPVGILGAAPTPVGGFTLNLVGTFERSRSGGANRDTYGAVAEFEAGLVEGIDLRVIQFGAYGQAAPYPREDGMRSWGGETRIGLRWQFLEEQGLLPALGVFAAVNTLYGESQPAQDAEGTLLFRKTLWSGDRPLALYVNAGRAERLGPQPGERPGRYDFGVGLAHSLADDTSAALSYQVTQQDRGERDQQLVQAGLFHRLSRGGPILAIAAGAGLNRDSPVFQLGGSVKWLLGNTE